MIDKLAEWANAVWGLWLMLIFFGIVAWVFWPGRKKTMEEHARIPFEGPPDDLPGEKEKTNGDR